MQKCAEVAVLAQAVNEPEASNVLAALAQSRAVQAARAASPRIHKPAVQARVAAITAKDSQRQSLFAQRIEKQRAGLNLPLFPTTTIGSFPQTASIRLARQSYKAGKLSEAEYVEAMHSEIKHAVEVQENLGLDVLVHGEAERNDMVEYFAEQLDGYAFTRFGWVQSYGSRCVKPALIFGDLSRPKAMTVEWIRMLPQQLVHDVEAASSNGLIPLASAEGFIRQLLGWREFMRHLHEQTDGYRLIDDSTTPPPILAADDLPATLRRWFGNERVRTDPPLPYTHHPLARRGLK